LSSTTDARRGERGQILIVFAGALVFILAVAALVFDVGQNLLDRRTEQNVSDAASLAGANYVDSATYTYHGFCSTAPLTMPAVTAACDLAVESGYVDGTDGRTVRVDMPPIAPSPFAGLAKHIQVTIGSTRPSFFAGVLGMETQTVGAMAVAKADGDVPLPYSLLALDPHGCGTNKINGNGASVTTNGTVHVDSDCATDAVLLSGTGVLTAPQCDVVGTIKTTEGATNACTSAPTGVLVSGDPLRNLPAPAKPGAPDPVQPLDASGNPCVSGLGACGTIPDGCPGGASPATDAAPQVCAFSSNDQKDKLFRIFPGLYPGGLETTRGIVYMSPGIYWIGGGGIEIKSTGGAHGVLVSKAIGDNLGTDPSGGVLIYNTTNSAGAGYGPIHLNGGDGSVLALRPIESGLYKGMVIFVDRAAAFEGVDDIDLNGAGSDLNVSGTIYTATGTVKLNGNESDSISAQVICYSFQVNGNGASVTIDYNPDDLFHLTGIGLVQ
jgi:hypothetical protein